MSQLIKKLINNDAVYRATPSFIKRLGRKWLTTHRYNESLWAKSNPFMCTDKEWSFDYGSNFTLGIFYDFAQYHAYYIKACHDEKISYKVLDISHDNWLENIQKSGCDAFLVWPMVYNRVWKQLCDNRLRILKMLKYNVFPSEEATWLYESKLRIRDWLTANDYPLVKTHVFYKEKEAINFAQQTKYPVVFKTDIGASANGVIVCKNKKQALKLIKTCFSKGFVVKRGDSRDRQWGFIIFQEYIENAKEWRLVRVGDSFFCRSKGKVGDFHSGSGIVGWAEAPQALLNLTYHITEKHHFDSINIDFFENEQGEFFINEVHALFGAILEKNIDQDDALMGRYFYQNGQWSFEKGFFYQNACANLRVIHLIEKLKKEELSKTKKENIIEKI